MITPSVAVERGSVVMVPVYVNHVQEEGEQEGRKATTITETTITTTTATTIVETTTTEQDDSKDKEVSKVMEINAEKSKKVCVFQ